MHATQQQATLTIALLAAFADGNNDEREREQIRALAQSLGKTPPLICPACIRMFYLNALISPPSAHS